MGARANGGRRPRGSLEPQAIIAAAAAFTDEHGVSNLTMAALARAMDVPVTSIHWHFRTRQALLDALAEQATAEFYDALSLIDVDSPWDEQLIEGFEALRKKVQERPRLSELTVGPTRAVWHPATARLIDMLVHAGFSRTDAQRILEACAVYVRGFVWGEQVAERERRGVDQDTSERGAGAELEELGPGWERSEGQFRLGLEALVTGLRTLMSTPSVVE